MTDTADHGKVRVKRHEAWCFYSVIMSTVDAKKHGGALPDLSPVLDCKPCLRNPLESCSIDTLEMRRHGYPAMQLRQFASYAGKVRQKRLEKSLREGSGQRRS